MSDKDKFQLDQETTDYIEKKSVVDETVPSSIAPFELESIEFMSQEGEELVDLDALFDALNLVAKENAEAISYADNPDQGGGILTVSDKALASVGVSSNLDELNAVTNENLTDHVISDES
ncbi:MAG: hypothetical protein JKX94_04305 [Sneathiella sp.]|nr:hypothetical protein [Sneathiella sp.]